MNDAKEDTETTSIVRWGPISAVLITVAVYFGGQVIGGLAASVWPLLLGWDSPRIASWFSGSTLGQFVLIVSAEAVTFWLLYGFIRHRRTPLKAIGLVKPRLKDAGYAVVGFPIYFLAYLLVIAVLTQLIPSLDTNQSQRIGFEQATAGSGLLLVFVSLVVLPPLIEEILCRGFLFSGLRTKLPVLIAALVTSVLFAAPHLQIGSGQPLLWIAFIDTFILSMVLVYIRLRSGSLWAPIGLHAIKNGVAFTALFIFKVAA